MKKKKVTDQGKTNITTNIRFKYEWRIFIHLRHRVNIRGSSRILILLLKR